MSNWTIVLQYQGSEVARHNATSEQDARTIGLTAAARQPHPPVIHICGPKGEYIVLDPDDPHAVDAA